VIPRLAKIAVTAATGVLLLLVAVNNVLDYGVNYDVVQHILSMDNVPPSPLHWRAIASPTLHLLLYDLIIAVEFAAALLSLWGVWRLWRARGESAKAFNAAKGVAVAGLATGFLLYDFGFMAVGGEWFQMWRAGAYNLQEPAFRFIGAIGLALLFLSLADTELE
jgi:predicted small integral membrane protein